MLKKSVAADLFGIQVFAFVSAINIVIFMNISTIKTVFVEEKWLRL